MKLAYIIDDEEHAAENLKQKILAITNHFDQIQIFNNASSACESILKLQPDIIFSDIEMPSMNGISLHERIQHLKIPLIFVTAHTEFSLTAIKQQVFDYILKPVMEEELRDSLFRFFDFENRSTQNSIAQLSFSELSIRQKGKILIHALEKIYIIPLEEIVSLKAEGAYTNIQMMDGSSITSSKAIKYFEEELSDTGFLRIHRSNMVNVVYVKEINKKEGDQILLINGKSVTASKEGKNLILDYFRNLS